MKNTSNNSTASNIFVSIQPLVGIAYIIIGLFQIAAIWAGLESWLGLYWFVLLPVSIVVTYIPILGTAIGIFGAINAWGWSGLSAFTLFGFPYIFVVLAYILILIAELTKTTSKGPIVE